MTRLDSLAAITGGILVTAGTFQYSTGAACIVAGVLLIISAFLVDRQSR